MSSWSATFLRCAKANKGSDRPVVYEIEVVMDGQRHRVYRRYNDFYNMHITLMRLFPAEAGETGQPRTIPYMPGKVILFPGQRKIKLAEQRIPQFNDYMKGLLAMDVRISRNQLVKHNLSRQDDDDLFEPQFRAAYKELTGDRSSDSSDSDGADEDGMSNSAEKKEKKNKKRARGSNAFTRLAGTILGTTENEAYINQLDPTLAKQPSGPAFRADSSQVSKDLGSGRAVVLYSEDGNDTSSSWKGARLKARARDPNQYAAFNLPWSKTSKMKLGNLFFCELMMAIGEDLQLRPRSDVFNTYEPCTTGLAIAEYLVGNVEGMDGVEEAFPVAQEMINLGVIRAINGARFEPSPSSFYYIMFTHTNLRISLGTIQLKQRATTDNGDLEVRKQQVLTALRYLGDRFGHRDATPLPPAEHKYRAFTHMTLISCDVCEGTLAGKSCFKCENCGINVHDNCSKIINRGFAREYCFYPPPVPKPIVSGEFGRELQASKGWANRYIPQTESGYASSSSTLPGSSSRANVESVSVGALSAIQDLQSKTKGNSGTPPNSTASSRPSPPTNGSDRGNKPKSSADDFEWDEFDATPPSLPTSGPTLLRASTAPVLPRPSLPSLSTSMPPPNLPPMRTNTNSTTQTLPSLPVMPRGPASGSSTPTAQVVPKPVGPPTARTTPPPSLPSSKASTQPQGPKPTLPARASVVATKPPSPAPSMPRPNLPALSNTSSSPSLLLLSSSPATTQPSSKSASSMSSAKALSSPPPPSALAGRPRESVAQPLSATTNAFTSSTSLPSLPSRNAVTGRAAAPAATNTMALSRPPLPTTARPSVHLLPWDFASDRDANLGPGTLSAEDREMYYQGLAAQAESAGQVALAAALLKLRHSVRRGNDEVNDLDRLLRQFASALDSGDW